MHLFVVFAVIATALIPAISTWALATLRTQVILDAETQTRNLARAFASHASRTIGEFAQDVNAGARGLTANGVINDDDEQFLHQTLQTFLGSSPQLLNAVVVNAHGAIIAGLRAYPEPRIDVSDRVYFLHHKNDPSSEILLGPAVRGRVSQRIIVTVTRRLTAPDGRFLGVLVTSLSPEYFTGFYATVSLGDGGIVELLNDAGMVLARAPATNGSIGGTSDAWSHIHALPRDRIVDTYRMEFPSDGIERIASVAAAENYPFFVQVAVSMTHALAPWRTQLYRQGAATLLAMLGLVFFIAVLLRAYARLVQSERAERHQAEILSTTISNMADAVLVADRMGRILMANPAAVRLFGDRPDVGSEDWARVYHPFLPDGVSPFPTDQTPMSRATGGEAVDNVEIVMRPDGAARPIHLVANGRPLREANGALKGAVVVYRDVTEAKETERQLRQAQKMDAVGQLTGGIAHDFNNILTVITGTIGILADAVAGRPQLTMITNMMSAAADRGAELTRHLLAFARRQPLQPRETDINALIIETAKLLRPTLGEDVEIESMLEDDAWPALVDPSQLTTALLNLALNARDAMPNGGKLTFDSANVVLDEPYAKMHSEVRPGPYVMVAVSDTGTGIPAAIRDNVFEPFFTTKEVGKGTGLGLSMVYGFVKQSAGHIKIYSEEGHGTSIKIYLPRASHHADLQIQMASMPAPERGTETILVVEDDALVRDYVIAQLQSLGYSTLSAANAAEALALVGRGAKFDLLFTDVIMSGHMNGRQLAEELIKQRPAIKVLFTSGYTENAIFHHGRLDPGVLLLAKPYRKVDLARMVRIALKTINTLPISGTATPAIERS